MWVWLRKTSFLLCQRTFDADFFSFSFNAIQVSVALRSMYRRLLSCEQTYEAFFPLSTSLSVCIYMCNVCMLLFYINFWIFNRIRKKSADKKMVYGSMVELSNRKMQYTSTTTIHHLIFRDENIKRTCYSIRHSFFPVSFHIVKTATTAKYRKI